MDHPVSRGDEAHVCCYWFAGAGWDGKADSGEEKAIINAIAPYGFTKLSQWAFIYGIASLPFAAALAIRFLSLPAWLDATIYMVFAAPVIGVVCHASIKRRNGKRIDRETAWRTFIRDRHVR